MTVLVTGAFGLVGTATVKQLVADGQRVVATDLDLPGNRKAAEKLTAVQVRRPDRSGGRRRADHRSRPYRNHPPGGHHSAGLLHAT